LGAREGKVCDSCYEKIISEEKKEDRNKEIRQKALKNKMESEETKSMHSTLVGIVWVIIIIYILAGIGGLAELSGEESVLKGLALPYFVILLIGLMIPLTLLAIYYKMK